MKIKAYNIPGLVFRLIFEIILIGIMLFCYSSNNIKALFITFIVTLGYTITTVKYTIYMIYIIKNGYYTKNNNSVKHQNFSKQEIESYWDNMRD